MSDIVTTLQDKDGNNIYPIAGGVNGNTITTAMLQNGAVTGAKIGSQEVTASNIDWSTIIDKIYPVGSIYMSASLSTPAAVAAALGGSWVAWGSGRVPVGVDANDADFDTVEETGGAKAHKHLMPFVFNSVTAPEKWQWNWDAGYGYESETSTNSYNIGGSPSTDPLTGQQPYVSQESSLQPYITCYMYKRTA